MITEILKSSLHSIDKAVEILKSGDIAAVPTETVYGLAANAYDDEAIRRIFDVKGRPQDNPLILHIDNLEYLNVLAKNIPEIAFKLADKFWPGALTMVFEKNDNFSSSASAGLDTIAVRMPDNKTMLEIIKKCGFPLAAPSANISGSPSPTDAMHVYHDLNGKVPLIIDGGQCECGVESTVICFTGAGVKILRPGAVTAEQLAEYVQVSIDNAVLSPLDKDIKPLSPGQKYKHYSPKAKAVLVSGDYKAFNKYVENNSDEDTICIIFGNEAQKPVNKCLEYGISGTEQAHSIFKCLREVDQLGAKKVYIRCPEKRGVSLAVYNRLIRASEFVLIELS